MPVLSQDGERVVHRLRDILTERFGLTTLDDESFDLARRKGSWVVLNFFNSTCVPCVAEHPEFKIPYFGFRGTPVGNDVHKVVATGITPVMDVGVPGRAG